MELKLRLFPGIVTRLTYLSVPHYFPLNYKFKGVPAENLVTPQGLIITYLFKLKLVVFGCSLKIISIKIDIKRW